ncbi:MAG: bacteriophage holin [Candidatus Gracilibacteria bacterium]|nr:bacteriophage holin [Candidatus Gracilibacteria bacterium]
METQKLSVFGLGISCGIVWAFAVLFLGLVQMMWGPWPGITNLIAEGYMGFAPTVGGSLIGALWGFVDAFIGGALVAWLYNMFAK